MIEDDVRDMLRRQAESVTASRDGFERIQSRLGATTRRKPVPKMLLVAAAVLPFVIVGLIVLAQGGDDVTSIDLTPADEAGDDRPMTTTTVVSSASASRLGVWPWPEDDVTVGLADPVETARAYVDARVGLSDQTTVSSYQEGDSNSGEVVFGGDISTTVFVRVLDGVWHVEGAATDLVTVHGQDDGSFVVRVEGDGWLQSFTRSASGSSALEPAHEASEGDEVTASARDEVAALRFLLTTGDGTKALTEVRVGPPFDDATVPPGAVWDVGGLDARELVVSYLADRLGGRQVEVRAFTATGSGAGVVEWEAGAVEVAKLGDHWFVVEAVGDSVQIAGAAFDAGSLRGELAVAEPGTLHVSIGDVTNTIVVTATGRSMVPFDLETAATSGALRVVFDTDAGFVSLTERVVD